MKQLFQDKDVKKELDRLNMEIYDIDVDKEITKKHNIKSIPTIITKQQRYVGSMSKEKFLEVLKDINDE